MSTTSTSKINRKLAFLGEAVARTRDPFKNGDVIRWSGRYANRGTLYTWVALKSGGKWYITGRTGGYASAFDDVVGLISRDIALVSLDIVATWTAVEL